MYSINIYGVRVTDGWMDGWIGWMDFPWHSLWNIYLLVVTSVAFHYTHDNLILCPPSSCFSPNPISLGSFLRTFPSYLLGWLIDLSSRCPLTCLSVILFFSFLICVEMVICLGTSNRNIPIQLVKKTKHLYHALHVVDTQNISLSPECDRLTLPLVEKWRGKECWFWNQALWAWIPSFPVSCFMFLTKSLKYSMR